nr:MAG TPA: hypothetical protein [Caudoviricetes sp.]
MVNYEFSGDHNHNGCCWFLPGCGGTGLTVPGFMRFERTTAIDVLALVITFFSCC